MDPAGFVATAMVGLWIAYLVPQRLQYRQQLLDSRADDRFSGGLRVLRVAEVPTRTRPARTVRPLLHPTRGTVRTGGGSMDRPHAAGDRIVADAVRRSAAEHAQRAAHLARRSAAARRRALLTVLLLVASVGGWVGVAVAGAAVVLGAVPTGMVLAVLVLGRGAVVAGARADAAWAAGAADRLPLSRTGGVVGRAVHPSEATTEIMARVPGRRSDAARAAEPVPVSGVAVAPAAGARDLTTAPAELGEPTWAPVPVPRPTYTLKAAAPRREPAPLTAEDLAPAPRAASQGTSEQSRAGAEEPATAQAADGLVPAESAPATPADRPRLDLDAVLARRRASGE